MDNKVPEKWDWITHRKACSAKHMFSLLVERLESDAKQMHELVKDREVEIGLNYISETKAVVYRKDMLSGFPQSQTVVFDRTEIGVTATAKSASSDKVLLTAVPGIDADGLCRFFVEGKPMELWQVSYAALERMFFTRWYD